MVSCLVYAALCDNLGSSFIDFFKVYIKGEWFKIGKFLGYTFI